MPSKLKYILFFIIGTIIIIVTTSWNREKVIDDFLNNQSKLVETTYSAIIDEYRTHADILFFNRINRAEILQIFAQAEKSPEKSRHELYVSLSDMYNHMESFQLKQLHFHLPNNYSFLRFHRPDKFGDDLSDVRATVKYVNETHASISGFEEGRIYNGYRFVYPLAYNNKHIGSVETSVAMGVVTKTMSQLLSADIDMYLDMKVVDRKVFKNEKSNYINSSAFGGTYVDKSVLDSNSHLKHQNIFDDLPPEIIKNVKNGEIANFVTDINNMSHIVTILPIKNAISNRVVAYMTVIVEKNQLSAINFRYLGISSLFIFFIGVVLLLVYRFEKNTNIIKNQSEIVKAKQNEIEQKNSELERILNNSKSGIAITDLDTNFKYVNDEYTKITGYTREELLTKSCVELTNNEDIYRSLVALETVISEGFVDNFEKSCFTKDNKKITVSTSMALLPSKKELVVNIHHITEQKRKENKLQNYLKLMDQYIISSTTDLLGNITNVSSAYVDMAGFSKSELYGKKHNITRHPDMPKAIFKEMWETITQNNTWRGEIKNRKKGGGYYWADTTITPIFDDEGNKVGYTAIRIDITDKKRIEKISNTDGLTDMYNRRYFNQISVHELNKAKRDNKNFALCILDVDHFKQYNDTYGHQMGDSVLIQIGLVLKQSTVRLNDYCFRLGGEEFGVLLIDIELEDAKTMIENIRFAVEGLGIVHEKNSARNYVTASFGLVLKSAKELVNIEQIYKEADENLYRAKELGRNRVVSS